VALGARGRDRAIAAALALAGYGALALAFGSPLPQSLYAKSQIYGTAGRGSAASGGNGSARSCSGATRSPPRATA
jgi:hypothetical protein